MIKHFSSVQCRKTEEEKIRFILLVTYTIIQNIEYCSWYRLWRKVWPDSSVMNAEARWSPLFSLSHTHTHTRSPPSDSCLNTVSQLSQHSLTAFQMDAGTANGSNSLLNIWTKPQHKNLYKELIKSWAEPERRLVWCLLFQTHQTRWSKSLFWASLLEAAGARPGCCCEWDSPWLRLKIKQHRIKATRRLHSFHRDRCHRTPLRVAGAGIFGFAVIMTVGMLVVSIQQMVDGGYANAAYADVPLRHCWWLQRFRITQARGCLCLQIKLDE